MSEALKKTWSIAEMQNSLSPLVASNVTVVDGKEPSIVDPNRAVVVTFGESPLDLLTRCVDSQVRHICQTDAGSFEKELNTAAIMLHSPQTFLDLPLATILRPGEITKVNESELLKLHVPFTKAVEKGPTLDQLRTLLLDNGRPDSLVSDAVLVADEMFTNAVFNAPFVDLKSGFNPGIDRNDSTIAMSQGQSAELLVGFDDGRLVIVVRDGFGTLNVEQFVRRIHDCCVKGVSVAMRLGSGGAGIGSHMVFNMSSSMYVGVSKGKSTVVAASLHWKWSNRRRGESTKNFHYFEI